MTAPLPAVIVDEGETLSGIALREYGHACVWPMIWRANNRAVPDPDVLQVGQILVIPKGHPL